MCEQSLNELAVGSPGRTAAAVLKDVHRTATTTWMLGLAAISGPIVAYMERRSDSWHLLGHSLVLWILIGLVCCSYSGYRVAIARTTAALILAVMGYYGSTAYLDRVASLSARTLAFWLLAACLGGSTLAATCVRARRIGVDGILASFVIIGMLLGDTVNIRGGLAGLENRGFDSFVAAAPLTDVASIMGIVGAFTYMVITCRRQSWSHLAPYSVVTGLTIGYVLISLPDYILFRL